MISFLFSQDCSGEQSAANDTNFDEIGSEPILVSEPTTSKLALPSVGPTTVATSRRKRNPKEGATRTQITA